MRRLIVVAAMAWTSGVGTALADCPKEPDIDPTKSGSLVTISVDFCKAAKSPAPAGATADRGSPAVGASGQSPPAMTLYGRWGELTKGPAPVPTAAAAASPATARADTAAIADAFSTARNLLDGPSTQELKGVRIDERDRVVIKVTHFNFVNFGVEYTIDKTVIEAYVTLNKLWSQVLGLGTPVAAASADTTSPCPQGASFQQCVVDWMWAQILVSRQLNAVTSSFKTQVVLDDASIENRIKPESTSMQMLRAQLVQLQSDTLTRKPESVQEIEWYKQVQAGHDKLIGQLDAYLRLAELTVSGQTKNIDKQQAGTLVTVKITAINALGNPAGTPVEIQYFVHSKYPVTFHAGYLYSSLKDVKFNQVRTVAGADLFQQVHDPPSVNTYAAFLSYSLLRGNMGRHSNGVLATLGTDFKEPGTRLYVGGTVKFLSRVYVGAGMSSATVSEGVNPVVEQIGSALGARDLFTAVATRRDWKPYFQLSFGVFN